MRTYSGERRSRLLARTAAEAKRYAVLRKVLTSLVMCLTVLTATVYVVSVVYMKTGNFTITVNKFDANEYALTLSETPTFEAMTSRLNAVSAEDITNMSANELPEDIDSINGEHNGDNYLAYTFYLMNMGKDTVTYDYSYLLTNVANELDRAIRIRIYHNGVPTTYARTRTDGTGPEADTTEFLTLRIAAQERVSEFAPGAYDKFTVVIWVEGSDDDCRNELLGGKMKTAMSFKVVESSAQN